MKARKRILYFVAVVAILFVACEKEELLQPDPTPEQESPVFVQNAVTDFDGNSYTAVQIGNQLWMAENLRTTHFADGGDIAQGTVFNNHTPYRYYPGMDEANLEEYGFLYNWNAVMHGADTCENEQQGIQGICPDGWHVPTDSEWNEMEGCLTAADVTSTGVRGDHAGKLAGGGSGTWRTSDVIGSPGNYDDATRNSSGFSALPAGGIFGEPYWVGWAAHFWTATGAGGIYACQHYMFYNNCGVCRSRELKESALSVRCVKDPVSD